MTIETDKSKLPKRALLVTVYLDQKEKPIAEEHIAELQFLCETYGISTVHSEPCRIRKYDPSTLITSGKLEELIALTKTHGADIVVFDDEISPAQQRNLEKAFGIKVSDRTEVILGVFAERAHTKEAQLQVDLALLKYEFPRLKRMWTHLGRQRMSGGYLKGEGEKQIEIDKRLLNKRISFLENEIAEVKSHRETMRTARERSGVPVFAIVGYTNAGKSTLLNALTDADVFVEDKLFATLDTTTRKYTLANNQEILLIDTVGFIRKLPHNLIAAFRSTLEEAVEADFLIHLIDATHPMALEQAETTVKVLKELGAADKPVITALNKTDRPESNDQVDKIRFQYPGSIKISALTREGFDVLEERIVEQLKNHRTQLNLRIPQSDYGVVSQIIRFGNVIHQDYEGNDVIMKVDLPNELSLKLKKYVQ